MLPRIATSAVFLAALTLASIACNNGQPPPAEAAKTEYLTQDIPPCTPVPGSPVDPCDSDAPTFEMGGALDQPDLGAEPRSLRKMIDGNTSPPALVTHLVLRGTYLPDTVRCTAGNPFRPPSYLRGELGDTANDRFINCYIDIRANAHVLGSGPSTLTFILFSYMYFFDYEEGLVEELRQQFETAIIDNFPGREQIIFIGPPVDLSSEVWRFMGSWDVQRRDDGTVIAVHPDRDLWRRLRPDDYQTHLSKLEMTLPAFTQAVTTAHQARVTEYEGRIGADANLPMLVNDANQLRQYFIDVGAYDHPDGPPTQPPPPTSPH